MSAMTAEVEDFDPGRVAWANDEMSVGRLIAALEASEEITFDLETTGLNEFKAGAAIVLASFTLDNYDTWLLPLFHPESPFEKNWVEVGQRVVRKMVGKYLMAHNGKFDLRWVYRHLGIDLTPWFQWDSELSSHLLDENRSRRLKVRAPETFGIPPWDDFDLKKDGDALRVSLHQLGIYAAQDTYWTQRLAWAHRDRMFTVDADERPIDSEEIEDARLGQVQVWTAMPTARTLAAVEQRGIRLDTQWVDERIEADTQVRDETRAYLTGLYEGLHPKASFAPTSHWFRDWTAKAVEAGDLRVVAMTKTGRPQWNKGVLLRLEKDGSKVAAELLRHRAAVKRLEYLRVWRGAVRDDGAVHSQYNVGSLVTGRLSSSGPNMQQVTKALRPAFIPRDGYYMCDFDYSQVEMRVAAFMSRSEPMMQAFRNNDDLHRMLAARISGKDPEDVSKDERQGGKAGNFGLLFGMGPAGLQKYAEAVYDVVMTKREAEQAYRAFFDQWEGMREWHARTIAKVERLGQVSSPIGRLRRFPGSGGGESSGYAQRAGINAPVQGFASDMMQMAAASIEGLFPGHSRVEGAQIVGTVHDSIVVEVRQEGWEGIVAECQRRMTDGVIEILWNCFRVKFDVPLVADAVVGTRWGLGDIYAGE